MRCALWKYIFLSFWAIARKNFGFTKVLEVFFKVLPAFSKTYFSKNPSSGCFCCIQKHKLSLLSLCLSLLSLCLSQIIFFINTSSFKPTFRHPPPRQKFWSRVLRLINHYFHLNWHFVQYTPPKSVKLHIHINKNRIILAVICCVLE